MKFLGICLVIIAVLYFAFCVTSDVFTISRSIIAVIALIEGFVLVKNR